MVPRLTIFVEGEKYWGWAIAEFEDMFLMALAPAVTHPVLEFRQVFVERTVGFITKYTFSNFRRDRPGPFISDSITWCYADPGMWLMGHMAYHITPLLRLLDHYIYAPFSRTDEGPIEPHENIQTGTFAILRCPKGIVLVLLLQLVIQIFRIIVNRVSSNLLLFFAILD